jgi:hypothetical protein
MLWGWLDMANNDNLPPPLDMRLVACLFSIGACVYGELWVRSSLAARCF